MRQVRRYLPWLGWAMAGVLALGIGGSALAGGLGRGPDAVAGAARVLGAADNGGGGVLAHRGGWKHAGRRWPVRGELTVPTDGGFEQVAFARGEVTAVSAGSLSIRSADGVVTTFALNADTRYRKGREEAERGDVKVGDQALASGPRSGQTITARRVFVLPERAVAPTPRPSPSPTPSPTPTP
jgi:hypothetical protein